MMLPWELLGWTTLFLSEWLCQALFWLRNEPARRGGGAWHDKMGATG